MNSRKFSLKQNAGFIVSWAVILFEMISAIRILPSENGTFTMYRGGRTTYVLRNGRRHVIPERYTLNRLGFQFHELKGLNKSMMDSYPPGDAVESLWDNHENSALMSLLKTGPNLVKETYKVFHRLLNPSMVYWKGDLLISGRLADDPKFQTIIWLNHNTSYDHTSTFEQGVKTISYSSGFRFNLSVIPHGKIFGEDPRLFATVDGRLYCVICHRFHRRRPELQMAYSQLYPSNNRIDVDELTDIKLTEFPKDDQKNWSPFDYKNKMLFIATLQPHRIVEATVDSSKSRKAHGKTVGLSRMKNFHWKYGKKTF
jgi:hypothetical protein